MATAIAARYARVACTSARQALETQLFTAHGVSTNHPELTRLRQRELSVGRSLVPAMTSALSMEAALAVTSEVFCAPKNGLFRRKLPWYLASGFSYVGAMSRLTKTRQPEEVVSARQQLGALFHVAAALSDFLLDDAPHIRATLGETIAPETLRELAHEPTPQWNAKEPVELAVFRELLRLVVRRAEIALSDDALARFYVVLSSAYRTQLASAHTSSSTAVRTLALDKGASAFMVHAALCGAEPNDLATRVSRVVGGVVARVDDALDVSLDASAADLNYLLCLAAERTDDLRPVNLLQCVVETSLVEVVVGEVVDLLDELATILRAEAEPAAEEPLIAWLLTYVANWIESA